MSKDTASDTTPNNTDEFPTDVNHADLLPSHLEDTVRGWLKDDMPSFDVGGLVVGSEQASAKLLMKSPGVFAGKPFVDLVFSILGCRVEWLNVPEGSLVNDTPTPVHLATVTGPVHQLLRGERTALNTLSRCSGVATASRNAVRHARALKWSGHVAGTRKTTPGFRVVEKYGLIVGGAATHRLDLSQMVMLKDNHVWSCGASIAEAVRRAKSVAGFSQKIEVECQSLDEAKQAAEAGADIVMLDNFTPARLKEDAKTLKELYPHVLIEASGNITIDNMADYLTQYVDIVSQGKLTQGYSVLDYSLKIVH